MFIPALSGFLLGASLIIAIGAQNAYVLRMGLLRYHVFWLCLFCAVSDAVLIILGIAGLGVLVQAQPVLLRFIALAGALFLSAYAIIAFRRALNPVAMEAANAKKPSLKAALAVCASLTWLNPHVYLDTVILLGAYSTQYSGDGRIAFGAGAAISSFVWFFLSGLWSKAARTLFC